MRVSAQGFPPDVVLDLCAFPPQTYKQMTEAKADIPISRMVQAARPGLLKWSVQLESPRLVRCIGA